MHLTRTAAIVVPLVFVLAACGQDDAETADKPVEEETPQIFDVSGTAEGPGGCDSEANGALVDGARITITDGDGTVIAFDNLGKGEDIDDVTWSGPCRYEFTVVDVPINDTDVYGIAFGDSDPFLFKQAEADSLDLSVGY